MPDEHDAAGWWNWCMRCEPPRLYWAAWRASEREVKRFEEDRETEHVHKVRNVHNGEEAA